MVLNANFDKKIKLFQKIEIVSFKSHNSPNYLLFLLESIINCASASVLKSLDSLTR